MAFSFVLLLLSCAGWYRAPLTERANGRPSPSLTSRSTGQPSAFCDLLPGKAWPQHGMYFVPCVPGLCWERRLPREARAQGRQRSCPCRPCCSAGPSGSCGLWAVGALPHAALISPQPWLCCACSAQVAGLTLSKSGFFVCLVWRFSFSQGSAVRPGQVSRAVAAFVQEAGCSADTEGKVGLGLLGF